MRDEILYLYLTSISSNKSLESHIRKRNRHLYNAFTYIKIFNSINFDINNRTITIW